MCPDWGKSMWKCDARNNSSTNASFCGLPGPIIATEIELGTKTTSRNTSNTRGKIRKGNITPAANRSKKKGKTLRPRTAVAP